jgi:hypothetical protein
MSILASVQSPKGAAPIFLWSIFYLAIAYLKDIGSVLRRFFIYLFKPLKEHFYCFGPNMKPIILFTK